MLKIFLVEDEIVMREGIKNNIDWEKEGFEFVGEASDGELAYPLIQKTRPDILITDIKMPFMDGLELSRLVKSEMPETSIVILSGYNEFDYAQKAINIGVTDYLVKPMTSAQLLEAIHTVEKKILENRDKEARRKDSSMVRQQVLLARQSFFRKMVAGNIPLTDLLSEGRSLGIDLAASRYNILLLQLFTDGELASGNQVIGKAKLGIESLQPMFEDVLMVVQGQEEYSFLFKASDEQAMQQLIETYCKKLEELLKGQPGIEYYGALGRNVARLSDLKKCYDEVYLEFSQCYLKERNQIAVCEDKAEEPAEEETPLDLENLNVSPADRKKLEQFINTGVKSEIDAFLEDYFRKIGTKNIQSLLFRQYITMDMYIIIQSVLHDLGYEKQELIELFGTEQDLSKAFVGNEGTREYLHKILEIAIDLREKSAGNKYAPILRQAKEYIEKNYDNEDLSLNRVAAEVNLSPNHFSTIFGQESGETFVEYLTRIRMEKAKQLLRTTQMRTTDIAFAVGYRDAHYFSYLFKKTQNCTPREYRNMD